MNDEEKLPHYSLCAYFDTGWVLSVEDSSGNLISMLNWLDFFQKDDVFTSEEMELMGFNVT